jgi:hypothetical protein
MQLELTDEEAGALLALLNRTIENDRYPLSPRIRVMRDIRAKLPGAPPEPPRRRVAGRVRGRRPAARAGHGDRAGGPPVSRIIAWAAVILAGLALLLMLTMMSNDLLRAVVSGTSGDPLAPARLAPGARADRRLGQRRQDGRHLRDVRPPRAALHRRPPRAPRHRVPALHRAVPDRGGGLGRRQTTTAGIPANRQTTPCITPPLRVPRCG